MRFWPATSSRCFSRPKKEKAKKNSGCAVPKAATPPKYSRLPVLFSCPQNKAQHLVDEGMMSQVPGYPFPEGVCEIDLITKPKSLVRGETFCFTTPFLEISRCGACGSNR